jgi:hypothetical protein
MENNENKLIRPKKAAKICAIFLRDGVEGMKKNINYFITLFLVID